MSSKQLSISTFFGGEASSSKLMLPKCPLCNQRASERDVNRHLDQGCPETSNTSLKEEVPSSQKENHDVFSDSDSDLEKIEVKTATLKASRSVSNNPKRFSGVQDMTERGKLALSPSPRKSKFKSSNRFSPLSQIKRSPKKESPVKRNLFGGEGDSRHIPFTQSKKQDPSHEPYYVTNFNHVLNCVLDFTDDRELFLDEEMEHAENFRAMSLDAKKLYVRLFQRKHHWLRRAFIKYEEVHDMDGAIEELKKADLVIDGTELTDLETMLGLLSAPVIRTLCKDMKVAAGSGKPDCVAALLKHSKQKSAFFGATSAYTTIKRRAKAGLGECYRVCDTPRVVFLRILSLYSLTGWWDERESDKGQGPQQLTMLLLVNQGKMTFPCVDIIRERKLFSKREDLLKFEEACAVELRMAEAFDNKDWEAGKLALEEAETLFEDTLKDEEQSRHIRSLPVFLRRFSRGSVLGYVLTKGVEVLERARRYADATDLLTRLIHQDVYLPDYHGHWYERLVLDLDQHLKRPIDSLFAIKEGLADSNVRVARRLSLCQRVAKICKAKKNTELQPMEAEFKSRDGWLSVANTPSVTIQGRLMPKDNLPGAKTVFVFDSGDGERLLCSVEEYVREYYRGLSFPEGLHAEGAVVNTLAALLFWDVMYDAPVPDAFRSPSQPAPLDFNSDDFYASRKEMIDNRLEDLLEWSDEELTALVGDRWERHHGIVSVVNWDLFTGPDHMLGLIRCFNRPQLAGICGRLMKNHRYTRSGFPDLTVWCPTRKEVQIVEVKGPNDRLSNKQVLWIEFLNGLGVNTVACYVEALGGKMLDKRSPVKFIKSPKKVKTPSPKKKQSPVKKRGRPAKRKLEEKSDQKKVTKARKTAANSKRRKVKNNDSEDEFQ